MTLHFHPRGSDCSWKNRATFLLAVALRNVSSKGTPLSSYFNSTAPRLLHLGVQRGEIQSDLSTVAQGRLPAWWTLGPAASRKWRHHCLSCLTVCSWPPQRTFGRNSRVYKNTSMSPERHSDSAVWICIQERNLHKSVIIGKEVPKFMLKHGFLFFL